MLENNHKPYSLTGRQPRAACCRYETLCSYRARAEAPLREFGTKALRAGLRRHSRSHSGMERADLTSVDTCIGARSEQVSRLCTSLGSPIHTHTHAACESREQAGNAGGAPIHRVEHEKNIYAGQ